MLHVSFLARNVSWNAQMANFNDNNNKFFVEKDDVKTHCMIYFHDPTVSDQILIFAFSANFSRLMWRETRFSLYDEKYCSHLLRSLKRQTLLPRFLVLFLVTDDFPDPRHIWSHTSEETMTATRPTPLVPTDQSRHGPPISL